MTDFEAKVLSDLCVLKNQMSTLMDGTTGRLPMLEADVAEHRSALERTRGFTFAFGLLFTGLQLLLEWLRHA